MRRIAPHRHWRTASVQDSALLNASGARTRSIWPIDDSGATRLDWGVCCGTGGLAIREEAWETGMCVPEKTFLIESNWFDSPLNDTPTSTSPRTIVVWSKRWGRGAAANSASDWLGSGKVDEHGILVNQILRMLGQVALPEGVRYLRAIHHTRVQGNHAQHQNTVNLAMGTCSLCDLQGIFIHFQIGFQEMLHLLPLLFPEQLWPVWIGR